MNREGPPELAPFLCWEKEEEDMESCSLMSMLDNIEGKK